MQVIGIFYYSTWFIWPFVFILSLVHAISSLVENDTASKKTAIVASVSLLIILAGITAPNFN
jgi:uncharacterized membrane protein